MICLVLETWLVLDDIQYTRVSLLESVVVCPIELLSAEIDWHDICVWVKSTAVSWAAQNSLNQLIEYSWAESNCCQYFGLCHAVSSLVSSGMQQCLWTPDDCEVKIFCTTLLWNVEITWFLKLQNAPEPHFKPHCSWLESQDIDWTGLGLGLRLTSY